MSMSVPSGDQGVVSKIISELKDVRDRHLKDEEMQGMCEVHAELSNAGKAHFELPWQCASRETRQLCLWCS